MNINPELFAALGPLLGTLTPEGALTAAQAQEQAQNDQVAQQAAAAGSQADYAGQQYQQAAAAPPPQANNFVQQLFSNAASTLSGNPDYAQGARTRGLAAQSDLMEARRQNLLSMRDLHQQKADIAREMGNHAEELKSRMAHDKVTKAIEDMDKARAESVAKETATTKREQAVEDTTTEHQNRLAEIAATGAENRRTVQTKAQNNPAERAALVRQGIDPTSGFTLRPFAMREMTKRIDLAKKGDSTSKNAALNMVMDLAATRWAGEDDSGDMAMRLERMYHPHFKQTPNERRYLLTGEKVNMRAKGGEPVLVDGELDHIAKSGEWITDPEAYKRVGAAVGEIVRPWYE